MPWHRADEELPLHAETIVSASPHGMPRTIGDLHVHLECTTVSLHISAFDVQSPLCAAQCPLHLLQKIALSPP
jgi:hypothetical protein